MLACKNGNNFLLDVLPDPVIAVELHVLYCRCHVEQALLSSIQNRTVLHCCGYFPGSFIPKVIWMIIIIIIIVLNLWRDSVASRTRFAK